MPSPFPGMDPYLEDDALWPDFHTHLIVSIHKMLLPNLVDRYRARLGQRTYVSDRARNEQYIEVVERENGRLVTLLDVVSPANKASDEGRAAFLADRKKAKAAGANVIEIDLVLQGRPTLDYSRDGLPDWDYAVTVTRYTHERYEIYTATLQKRLPRFRVPLAADDRDAVLDLQSTFTRCYDTGEFSGKIDYGRPPHEVVASLAYRLWQREGRPHGRDRDHWFKAIEMLRPDAR
jgi:Protein of unknown function (DUF4058)/Protein of unknown function (DUF2934)